MFFTNVIKAIILGIIEGITEWLPISSTGHLILADEFVRLEASEAFMSMFNVVIQLGAILAVVVLYFNKLNPFASNKNTTQKKCYLAIMVSRNCSNHSLRNHRDLFRRLVRCTSA